MRTNEKMSDTAETRAPSVHNEVAVEAFRRAHRIDPDRIRRMRHALYQGHESVDAALRRLDRHGPSLAARFLTQAFEIQERFDSQIDQSSKWILKAEDGIRVETVSEICLELPGQNKAGQFIPQIVLEIGHRYRIFQLVCVHRDLDLSSRVRTSGHCS